MIIDIWKILNKKIKTKSWYDVIILNLIYKKKTYRYNL